MQSSRTVRISSKIKTKCRERHHDIHSPKMELSYCNNCRAYVEVNKLMCECCGEKISKQLNHKWLHIVLKRGIEQHQLQVMQWAMWPAKEPVYVEIKFKGCVYETEIKYLALFNENQHLDEILPVIYSHTSIKGYRVWIPETEENDSCCRKCHEKLLLDKNGDIYCRNCITRNNHTDEVFSRNEIGITV